MYYGNFNYQQPVSADERIWVPNQQAAESYLLAPGGFVRLWDSNRPIFYERKADASGRPYPLEIYEYKKSVPQITQEEVLNANTDELKEQITALTQRIEALETKRGVKNAAKQSDDATA